MFSSVKTDCLEIGGGSIMKIRGRISAYVSLSLHYRKRSMK